TKFNNNEIDLTNKDVVVIGAGNVAMDAARSANRSNANKTTIVYRRTLSESTASKLEILGAKEDNVIFKFLSSPNKFNGSKDVESLTIEVMNLVEKQGERPYPVGTGEFEDIKCDYVILAIGQKLPLELKNDDSLEFDEWNNLLSRNINDKVFFGGDMINGPSSVAKAINDSNDVLNKILEKK
ncbi:MAG: FAD-dependent oxidoreductase, partial [bacterium]